MRSSIRVLFVLGALMLAREARADDTTKGPYFIDVDSTSARVFVETQGPAQVALRVQPEGATALAARSSEAPPSEAEGAPHAGASNLSATVSTRAWREDGRALGSRRLRDLEPDTTYRVQVVGSERSAVFRTAPVDAEQLSFIVYGDNRTQHERHREVVNAILREDDIRFALHTGDLVEVGGRVADWDTAFEISDELFRRTPVFPSLGNHEIYGPGGRAHYMRHLAAPGTRVSYYDRRYGPVRVIALDSNEDFEREGQAQIDWLRARLAEPSDARFTFALMHHAPISSGRHGGHEAMRELGVPEMLRDAGVDLVFSGHDHMYERGDAEGYRYIVTGGGGAPLYLVNRRIDGQLAFVPEYHFLRVDIDGDTLRVSAIRPDGEAIERCELRDEGWMCENGTAAGPIEDGEAPDETVGTWKAVLFAVVSLSGLFLLWRSRKRRRRQND